MVGMVGGLRPGRGCGSAGAPKRIRGKTRPPSDPMHGVRAPSLQHDGKRDARPTIRRGTAAERRGYMAMQEGGRAQEGGGCTNEPNFDQAGVEKWGKRSQ